MLADTLRHADRIVTVSNAAKAQIEAFMKQQHLPPREVIVTFEPCAYESVGQPENPAKDGYVHLGWKLTARKGTGRLVGWWIEQVEAGRGASVLRVVGEMPEAVRHAVEETSAVMAMPFMADVDLQVCYQRARALVFPVERLRDSVFPALEAYFLGTPVCYVRGTAVEEVLSVATAKERSYNLEQPRVVVCRVG